MCVEAPPPPPHTFVLPLPCALPTPNSRLHWAARAKLTRTLRNTSRIIAQSVRHDWARPTGRVHITLTLLRGKGQKFLDVDAVPAALKPVLDGLVDAGWARDDHPKWLRLTTAQARTSGPPAVRVSVASRTPDDQD